jgi:putative nucleotidyltransferase with HDIG domain
MNRQEMIQKAATELPPLPELAMRILTLSQDPESSPKEIVEVVKLDPTLTMRILGFCNSPFYGLQREISSLQEAIVYLGTDAIVNFVLASSMAKVFPKENSGYGLDEGQLWRHAVAVAICSQLIAEKCAPELSALAFTSGLVHDAGKIAMNRFVGEEITDILQLVEKEGISFLDAEQRRLGYTHCDAGADVAKSWALPKDIIDTIRYHHNPTFPPDEEVNETLIAVVHVGNILCISFGYGVGSDGLAYAFHSSMLKVLNLAPTELYNLSVSIHEKFSNAANIIELQ